MLVKEKEIDVFCFGFGQVAKNFVKKLSKENFKIKLTTTSRNKSSKKRFNDIAYDSLQFDGDNFDTKIIEQLKKSSHILVSTPPNAENSIIKNFKVALESNPTLNWFGYLSSTSVYGNHNGRWVDENTITIPTSKNGKKRLFAEKQLKKLNIPLIIFRLSGIYSSENNVLNRLKKNLIKIVEMENQIFSRIHVEDIANVLFNSSFAPNLLKGEIFNVCDNYPCSYKEVVEYGCKILNIKKPEIISFEELESETMKEFYKDSKKVSNKKMKKFFNYKLKYPTYIDGLSEIRNNSI
ncbi:oxidoreductase [Candidatus Pelagibacter sp.]|nr:oxidoreductase [Candidatus Pelagibacter sp.]